ADERTRLHTEERHHLPAVERRPNAIEFLLLAQLRDARFELVDTPVQRTRLRLVACGAVLSHEVVERLQQRTGVADVAAHGAVGPSHRIRVDAQVEIDETGDVLDHLVREVQRAQSLLRHARADDFVMVEADTTGPDRTRLGLPMSWRRAASRT